MAVTRRILDVGNTRAKWATFDNGNDLTQPPAQLESAPVAHLDTQDGNGNPHSANTTL